MADAKKTDADSVTTDGKTTTTSEKTASGSADKSVDSKAGRTAVKAKPAATEKPGKTGDKSTGATTSAVVARVRTLIGQVIWLICVVCALFLAIGALTYALNANPDNALVEFVRDGANAVDLGVFSLENGIKEFVGKDSDVKNALVNWGIGAVAYLVVGRILDRLIRP